MASLMCDVAELVGGREVKTNSRFVVDALGVQKWLEYEHSISHLLRDFTRKVYFSKLFGDQSFLLVEISFQDQSIKSGLQACSYNLNKEQVLRC